MTEEKDDIIDTAYIEEKITDSEARSLLDHLIKNKQIPEITKQNLGEVIKKIKEIKNLSNEQIFRILGINRNQFYYITKKK